MPAAKHNNENTTVMSEDNALKDRDFGQLHVIGPAPRLKGRDRSLVKCTCGREKIVLDSNLKAGRTTSCRRGGHPESLVGQPPFGKLTVIADAPPKPGTRGWRSVCRCECGNVTVIPNSALKSGNSKSCGCDRIEKFMLQITKHGHTSRAGGCSRTYQSWKDMKNRCLNPNATNYKNYGGRGIKVCDRWMDFKNFLADMGPCPPGLEIDRWPDNTAGNYSCGHCDECQRNGWAFNGRWATESQQQRNKRNNRDVTVRGVKGCLKEVCQKFGVSYEMVKHRLRQGWSVEAAFFTPSGQEPGI
jgi:hypothetical protein